MIGVTKSKVKHGTVYFGHPFRFWKERQRLEMEPTIDVAEMKKLTDVVDYDNTHLQKARGVLGTVVDEKRLREMQKLQMIEKKCMEQEEADKENMWHQVLVNDVRRKEERERLDTQRRHAEMLDRRKAYDEQIASANKKRREALQEERERERRRLERMREKMEQDHFEDIKKKRDQQMRNKTNFIEGHELKLMKKMEEKCKERELDNNSIRVALEQLRAERLRKREGVLNWRREEETFTQNFNRERKIAEELDVEAEKAAQEWKLQEEQKTDAYLRQVENERRMNKEKATQEYLKHLERLKEEMVQERRERSEKMQRVSRTAYKELQRSMETANEEFRKQIDYRNTLKKQIQDNHKSLDNELNETEMKDWPFTKKSEMFSDVMLNRYKKSPVRKSTNPIHPFKRIMDSEAPITSTVHLPIIGTKYK